jgi:hypothetical protein
MIATVLLKTSNLMSGKSWDDANLRQRLAEVEIVVSSEERERMNYMLLSCRRRGIKCLLY